MSKSTVNPAKSSFDLITRVLPHVRTALMWGLPSLGKSFLSINTPHAGGSYVNITLTSETPSAELRGHYIPVGGEFVWKDGPAITAWRGGHRLILNEVNLAGGDTLAFLLALLDSPESAAITLPTGETVRPHPKFQCIGTMNGTPEDLPEALRSRFPVTVEITEPNPAAIQALPMDLQDAARGSCVNPNPELRISLRSWFEFAKLRPVVGATDAADAVFGKRAKDILASLTIAASP